MKTSIFIATVVCTLIQSSHASETDAFTFRYADIADSTDLIDAEINRRMNEAMDKTNFKTNSSSTDCNTSLLFKNLGKKLQRPVYGIVEGWIKRHKEIPHGRVPVRESIYRDIPFFQNLPVHAGQMGLGPVLRVNGHLIGNDKIGHFLDEGRHYYESLQEGKSLSEAVAFGDETEKGKFGLKATGVYSFADTAANYNGMLFWERINGDYFTCDQGTWKRKSDFTFRDYVDAAWDEGINCSEYRDEEYRARVINQIKILEENDEFKRPYQCPVVKTACDEIAPKYGEHAKDVLNPACRTKL